MVARQITFTASESVQEIIKDANIPSNRKSKWINDKITKAVMIEKEPQEENLQKRVNGEIIEVKI